MKQPSIRVQSVIYQNDPSSLKRAVEYLANAVRVERQLFAQAGPVTLVYGDASPSPVFSEEELRELQEKWGEFLQLDYRFFGFNTGSAKGHNLLAQEARDDYLLIMNPDVLFAPRCLMELLGSFTDSKIALVEARQSPLEHPKVYDEKTLDTSWATTACALVSRSAFEEIGGFDSESFFLYCDDVDFSWRLRLKGYRVLYQPLAVVNHAKRLDREGKWIAGGAEVYYSAEAALFMAHKYSNPTLLKQLLLLFSDGTEPQRRAAAHFLDRQREGSLPEPIDPAHKVASFEQWVYGEYRFMY